MLADRSSSAIVPAKDIARARAFYEATLGLEVQDDMGSVLAFRTGGTRLLVYESGHAGTNRANAVVWDGGDDFDAIAAALRERGVTFEEYPELGMDIADGIHSSGGFKALWFKDPDGNILHVNNM